MEELIAKIKENRKIIIRGEEYNIKTKTWYSLEEDETASYVKCELTQNKVLVIIPEDELIYIGKIIPDMEYEKISENQIIYQKVLYTKTGEGHQIITKIEFGKEENVEGKCIFEDYESEKNTIISLGVLIDKQIRADIYADILKEEDIVL